MGFLLIIFKAYLITKKDYYSFSNYFTVNPPPHTHSIPPWYTGGPWPRGQKPQNIYFKNMSANKCINETKRIYNIHTHSIY